MENVKCPICNQDAVLLKTYDFNRERTYHCNLCGYFKFTRSEIQENTFRNSEIRNKLIFALHHSSSKDNIIEIDSYDKAVEIIGKTKFPRTSKEKLELLLLHLYKQHTGVFTLSYISSTLFGVENITEFYRFREYVEESEYIKVEISIDSYCEIYLSMRGIDFVENLQVNNKKEDHIMESNRKYKCFIVHGHNDVVKLKVARFIESLNINNHKIEVIILHEQSNQGRTIIEKFEAHSDVDFAVCLYTADDEGKAKKDSGEPKSRARQNVVFEAGIFTGKLGRKNVIILKEDSVENPSDIDGIVYISLAGQWTDELRKEIEDIYSR